ncbi:type II secretion system ATPase GspE [Acetohalobium arabaticum]|uniref:protein-secreting ATPase n=1 Tax=Acetohalobium arabaticum (strain ATCC 49924 / DSM 5501 / Z-7288) TaxID=574087 RepID=D9QRY8_ACEAZ|nr:type II secretion system ATPase GspE [Acetohalobium arabaticum]ADL13279.1 type II secretion system protein E (GspE) [Acetohalobium arabaticum DSM 5501]
MIKKKRLGDILVDVGFITEEELQEALEQQKGTEKRLGTVLKEMKLVTEQDVMEALEYQLGIPQVNLNKFIIDSEVIKMIPQSLAERHRAIPIKKEDNTLTVAMADPLDVLAIDDIRIKTDCEVIPVIASEDEIQQAIEQYFGSEDIVNEFIEDIDARQIELDSEEEMEVDRLREMVDEAPVVRLVNNIINEGVKLRASDIHIEPQGDEVQVRYRVDGILRNEMDIPKHTHSALVSRIKIMADMDIAERRRPQDGRIQMMIRDKEIDLRISVLPTIEGEKVVIRILDKDNLMLELNELGFLPEHLTDFKSMIQQPHGMLLITGPTGSGKTTTLYSALNRLNTEEKNIITIEDPVEYTLNGINQVQTNPQVGLTFADGLRSILRQDPDIVMVGEIRDKETAEIAIHAALTGHLVLTTLHTNEAAGALTRLINMGIEPFLVASSVIGVVAQRLVRTICDNCKAKDEELAVDFNLGKYIDGEEVLEIYEGDGCRRCNERGYLGRTAIHEILEIDSEIKKLIVKKASAAEIEEQAVNNGMITLESSGLEKVNQGITTLEEVMRVTKVYVD